MEVKYTPEYRNEREYLYGLAEGSGLWDEKAVAEISDENRMDYIKAMAYHNQIEDTSKFNKEDYETLYDAEDKYNYLMWTTFSGEEDSKTYEQNKSYFDEKIKESQYRRVYDSLDWFSKTANNIAGLTMNIANAAIDTVEGFIDFYVGTQAWQYIAIEALAGRGAEAEQNVKDFIARDIVAPNIRKSNAEFVHYQTGLERETGWKVINDVATNLAKQAVALIPVVGPTIYFGSMAGNVAEEAIIANPDISYGNLVAYTGLVTGVEFATEKLVGDAIFGKGVINPNKLAARFKNPIVKYITKTGLSALGEGLEESLAEVLDGVLYQWFVDGDKSISFEDVLYAGVIGALSGGIIDTARLITTKKIDNLSKLNTQLYVALNEDLVSSVDKSNALTELRSKYGDLTPQKIQQLRHVKDFSREYDAAIESSRKQEEKIAKNYTALAMFCEKIGYEKTAKAQELLKRTVEQKAAMARAEVVYSDMVFNALEQQQVDLYNERVKDGTHFIPNRTFTDTEYKLIDNVRRIFPGYTVSIGEVTSGKEGKAKPMWKGVTIHERVIFVNKADLANMSLEDFTQNVVMHELVHNLQRDGNILSKKMMDELDSIMKDLGFEIDYSKIIVDTKSKDPDIIRAEQQAEFYSHALFNDSTVINAIFATNKSTFAKIYSWFARKSKTISTQTKKGIQTFRTIQQAMELYRKTISDNVANTQSANIVMDKIPELTESQREEIIASYQTGKVYEQWLLSSFDNTALTTKILNTENTLWNNVRPEFKRTEFDISRILDENYYTDEFRKYILENFTDQLFGEDSFESAMDNFLYENNLLYHKKSNKLIKSVDMSKYIKTDIFNEITKKARQVEKYERVERVLSLLKDMPSYEYTDLLDINNYEAHVIHMIRNLTPDTTEDIELRKNNYDKYLQNKFDKAVAKGLFYLPSVKQFNSYADDLGFKKWLLRDFIVTRCGYLSDLFDLQKLSKDMNAVDLYDVEILYTDERGALLDDTINDIYNADMTNTYGAFNPDYHDKIFINLDELLINDFFTLDSQLYETIIHESTHLIANSQGLEGGANVYTFEKALVRLSGEEYKEVVQTLKAEEYMLENQKADVPNIASILYQLVAGEKNARLFTHGGRFGTYNPYETAIYIENGKFVFTGNLKSLNNLSWNRPRTLKDLGFPPLSQEIKPTYATKATISDTKIRRFPGKRTLQILLNSIRKKYNLKTLDDFKAFGFSQKFLNTIDVETDMATNMASWKKLYKDDEIMEKDSPNKADVMEFLKDDLIRVVKDRAYYTNEEGEQTYKLVERTLKTELNAEEEIENLNKIKDKQELKSYLKNRVKASSVSGITENSIYKYMELLGSIQSDLIGNRYDKAMNYLYRLLDNVTKSFNEEVTSQIEAFDSTKTDEKGDTTEDLSLESVTGTSPNEIITNIEKNKKEEADKLKNSLSDRKSFIKFISPKVLEQGKVSVLKIRSYYNDIKTYMREYLSEKELDKAVLLLDYLLHKVDESAKNLPKIKALDEIEQVENPTSDIELVTKILNLSENPTQKEMQSAHNKFYKNEKIQRVKETNLNRYEQLHDIKNAILKEKGFQRRDKTLDKLNKRIEKLSKILDIKNDVIDIKNKITSDTTTEEMLQFIEDLDNLEKEFKKSVSKKKIVSATIAPYLNTKLSDTNYDEIKSKVDEKFKKASKDIADLLGLTILEVHDNIGGYTMQSGEVINEISYTFQFETTNTNDVDLFASLMGDLGYENQEAVISANYVKKGENGLELSVVVKNTDNIRTLLNEAGINDFTIDLDTKEVKILEFPWMGEEGINTLHENLNTFIDLLGDNYESSTKSKIKSRYLDRRDRQNLYKKRLATTETSGQNRKLRDNTKLEETIRQAYEIVSLELGESVSLIETQSQSTVELTNDVKKLFSSDNRKGKVEFVLNNTTENSKLSDIKNQYNLSDSEYAELKDIWSVVYNKPIKKSTKEIVVDELKEEGKISEKTASIFKGEADVIAENAKLIIDLKARAELEKAKPITEKTLELVQKTKNIQYSKRYTKSKQSQLDETSYLQSKSHDEFKLQFREIFYSLEDDQVLPFLNAISENVNFKNSDEVLNMTRAYTYIVNHINEKLNISKEDIDVIKDNYAIIRRSEAYALRGDPDFDTEHPVSSVIEKFKEETDIEVKITKELVEEALGDVEKLKEENEQLLKELKEERNKNAEYTRIENELNELKQELKTLEKNKSVEEVTKSYEKRLKEVQEKLEKEKELTDAQRKQLKQKENNFKQLLKELKPKSILERSTDIKDDSFENAYEQLINEIKNLKSELETAKKEVKPKHPLMEEDNAELNTKIYWLEDLVKAINEGDYEMVFDLSFKEASTGLIKEDLDTERINKMQLAVTRAMNEAIEELKKKKAHELTLKQKRAKFNTVISKIKNYRFFSMLSNPATWFRNYIGNAIMSGLSNLSDNLYSKWHDDYTSKILEKYNNDIDEALKDPNLKEEDKYVLQNSIAKNQLTYRTNEEISEGVEKFVEEISPWIHHWSQGNKYDSAVKFGKVKFNATEEQLFKNKFLNALTDLIKTMLNKADFKFVEKHMRKAIANILQGNMSYIKESVIKYAYAKYDVSDMNSLKKKLSSKLQSSKTAGKFYNAIFQNDTHELLKVMPDDTFDLLIGTAANKSLETFFRNENALSRAINKIAREHPAFGLFMSITNPFIKVSTNMMKAFYQYSPFGFISVIKDRLFLKNNYKNSITEMEDMFIAAGLSEKAAKATVGTVMFITGLLLSILGKSLGVGIDFDDEEYMGAVFKITDSFKIRLSDLSPIGGTLALGSVLTELFRNPSKSLEEFTNLLNEYTLLGIANDYVQYNQNSLGLLGSMFEGWITQYIPSIIRSLAKVIDPAQKKMESNYLLHLLQTIASYLPGFSYAVPNKVSAFTGDTLFKSSNVGTWSPAGNRVLAHFYEVINAVSPIKTKLTVKSNIQKEAERAGASTTGLSGSFKINGETIKLTGFDNTKYSNIRANYVNKELNALINSAKYKRMDDEDRAKAIKSIYTNATELTKTIYWTDKGNIRVFTSQDEYSKYAKYLTAQRNIRKKYKGYSGSKYIKK